MKENETKKRIVETAYMLFREKGYDKITVNDICEACGITKTTFYYHLGSKEEIIINQYRGVVSDQAGRLVEVLAAKNYWEQLMTCFEHLMEASAEIGPDIFGQILIMNLREDKGSLDFEETLTRMSVILIERAQQAGQIRNSSEPLALYRAACHTYEGYELMWCVKKGGFDRKRAVRHAMEQIFDVDPALRVSPKIAYTY